MKTETQIKDILKEAHGCEPAYHVEGVAPLGWAYGFTSTGVLVVNERTVGTPARHKLLKALLEKKMILNLFIMQTSKDT